MYKGEVRQVFESGMVNVPAEALGMLTVSPPGVNVHTRRLHGVTEVCPCTPAEGFSHSDWNGSFTQRTNRLLRDLGRSLGCELEVAQAREWFRDDLLHGHLLIVRSDGLPLVVTRKELRRLLLKHGFGHKVMWRVIDDAGKASRYVAKYVAKGVSQRGRVAWRKVRRDGTVQCTATYRTWTTSRRWGLSMAAVRAARRDAAAARRAALAFTDESYPNGSDQEGISRLNKAFFGAGRWVADPPWCLEVDGWRKLVGIGSQVSVAW
jgi:hypothetical protein